MGNGGPILEIDFADGYCDGKETFNIERSIFDNMLLRQAGEAGVEIRENTAVKEIAKLEDGDVRLITDTGEEIRGRYILDASGQGTVIGRHLGTKVPVSDPKLQKVAYVGHFEGVIRSEGNKAGNPLITMMEEGWFWIIPISPERTSVGMVLDVAVAKKNHPGRKRANRSHAAMGNRSLPRDARSHAACHRQRDQRCGCRLQLSNVNRMRVKVIF